MPPKGGKPLQKGKLPPPSRVSSITCWIRKTLGYVRVTVELMAENEADLKLLEQHDPLIRDAIIRLMGSKSADQIKSLVSREDLRKECQTRANELLVKETGKKAVRELIFTKFLYQ